MILHECRLGNTISKITESLTLWETARGRVQIDKSTLALPVMLGDRLVGYVFHGHGSLVLDMIIETEQGAIGRSVEERTDHPFMMLQGTQAVKNSLSPASQEDFSALGYMKQQEFAAKAEDFLSRFHARSFGLRDSGFSDIGDGLIFAFQKEADELDILLVKGEKIIHKTRGAVFMSNGKKEVLKGLDGLVYVSNGKSIIVKQ